MNQPRTMTTLEKIALGVSAAIAGGSVIYWIWQIKQAADMLALAHGG
jgi:hypothetical protein